MLGPHHSIRVITTERVNPPKFLNMQYVYILQSKKDGLLYVGCTEDVKKRIELHNSGKVASTKSRRPFKVIYYEAFTNKQDAFCREQWLKTGWGKNHIKKI
jgi:putative endonuclease